MLATESEFMIIVFILSRLVSLSISELRYVRDYEPPFHLLLIRSLRVVEFIIVDLIELVSGFYIIYAF